MRLSALLPFFLALPTYAATNIVGNADFAVSAVNNSGSVENTSTTMFNNWTRPGNYQWNISSGVLGGVDDTGALSTVQAINNTSSLTGIYSLAFDYSITDTAPVGPAGFRVQIYGVNTGTGTWRFDNWATSNATLGGNATSSSLFDQIWTGDTSGAASFSDPTAVNLGTGFEFVVIRIAKEPGTQFSVSDAISIDNFSLTANPIPEPSRALLLMAGSFLIIARRRRNTAR